MITQTNQSLSNIFDVEPTMHEVIVPEIVAPEQTAKVEDTDFEIARTTMHNILLKGSTAIENALVIANGNEEADSYNAVSNLIGKMTEASVKLMGLHEIKAKMSKPVTAPITPQLESGAVSINGPVFVGTTSELSRLVMEQRKLLSNTQQGDL